MRKLMRKSTSLIIFLCQISIFSNSGYSTQEKINNHDLQKKTYRVPRVNSEMHVDAYLNESFWNEAVKIDANIEVHDVESQKFSK